jgi:predicted transcriptional regulator
LDNYILYFIITGIFFINGFLISYTLKLKKTITSPVISRSNDYSDILEAIHSSKQSQIDTITHKVNDIQIKLDLIESTLSQFINSSTRDTNLANTIQNITDIPTVTSPISSSSSDISNKSYPKISHITLTENNNPSDLSDKQNATNYYILKILLKKSMTSNEIKNAIGRTREHTARVMKKLYDLKVVDRDTTTKPFKYKLTEQGKRFIEEHREKNDLQILS